jgi:hypothetical protein
MVKNALKWGLKWGVFAKSAKFWVKKAKFLLYARIDRAI